MATLHLPGKSRAGGNKESPQDKADRKLEEGLEETFPASDPVAVTMPGGATAPDEKTPPTGTVRR